MEDFVHLHLHTEYSLLDGACHIKRLFAKANMLGQSAVAITDHGVLYGAVEFYKTAKEYGIKPVIGCEVYVASRTRFDRDHMLDRENYHLILLCENMTGYKNLIKLVSLGFTEGFYSKPRVDEELLGKYHEGLIALSACIAGRIPSLILEGEFDAAKEYALKMRDIFGEDNFFLEIQNHGIQDQLKIINGLTNISKTTGIPLVATNDVHYVNREDAGSQQVLMCIQTNTALNDDNKIEFETEEYYFKSAQEMTMAFPGHKSALENTVKIAERCNVDFEFDKRFLPGFTPPDGSTPYEYLRTLFIKGLAKRLKAENIPSEKWEAYKKRLEYELSVIAEMGFCEYFLIVNDFVSFAKNSGIYVGPGRGSGAGSLGAWCLGITDVDPIKYGLIFERFLNPERVSMPDFDIDFCYERRHEVIEYVTSKYGEDHVAQIITFNTMAARAVVRDVGRVLGLPYAQVDEAAKLIGRDFNITLERALKENAKFKALYDSSPDIKRMVDIAKDLEGMPRHASIHAAGVVITEEPVMEYVPLAVNTGSVVTQFPMNTIADLGLLKIDFLGLRYLTVLKDAVELVRKRIPDFSLDKISIDDKETYEMLSKGNTAGVFQLESAGMTNLIIQLAPENIEDITAAIALYRPGPMESIPRFLENRKNRESIKYKVKELEDILKVTNGCIVYQEQVMEIFRSLAGYSYGRADLIRRAMSKKKHAEMDKERTSFIYGEPDVRYASVNDTVLIDGCVRRGINEETAGEIFDEMSDFANYAFNKSHACAYSFVTFYTAYLKCKFPKEYLAARMNAALIDGKLAYYAQECARLGIKTLPPDINESFGGFVPCDEGMRFGLSGIKNVGVSFINDIFNERSGRPFASFSDFINRMAPVGLNKRMVESLCMAGAFDSFGIERNRLIAVIDNAIESVSAAKRRNVSGQLDIFSQGGDTLEGNGLIDIEYPELPPMTEKERLLMEKEICGLYLSGHPLSGYDIPHSVVNIGDIVTSEGDMVSFDDGDNVTVSGIISGAKVRTAKSGGKYAFADIEDMTGRMELIIFDKVLSKYENVLLTDKAVLVNGDISVKEDEMKLVVKAMKFAPEKGSGADLNADPFPKTEKANTGNYRSKTPDAVQSGGKCDANRDFSAKNSELIVKISSAKKLYLRFPSKGGKIEKRVLALLGIFEGNTEVYVFYNDERKLFRLSGLNCSLPHAASNELIRLMGEENIEFR
ncbi:MAG: DNA polymerase III subunit alpha [Ruminococcaceae bacterium]|nr:DNA polymerase III subunit alpha [Oscillospiraceae bacterium]